MQFIVICLKDSSPEHPKTYVQPSRRRYLSEHEAQEHKDYIAPSRQPVIVPVPDVTLNDWNYPVYP